MRRSPPAVAGRRKGVIVCQINARLADRASRLGATHEGSMMAGGWTRRGLIRDGRPVAQRPPLLVNERKVSTTFCCHSLAQDGWGQFQPITTPTAINTSMVSMTGTPIIDMIHRVELDEIQLRSDRNGIPTSLGAAPHSRGRHDKRSSLSDGNAAPDTLADGEVRERIGDSDNRGCHHAGSSSGGAASLSSVIIRDHPCQ